MDVKQTCWQVLAAKRWPGFAIQGDGEWAVVDSTTHAVMLLAYEANARNIHRAKPWCRSIYKLEVIEIPVVWERDEYDGPNSD